jgi:2-aminoadipate transaminase
MQYAPRLGSQALAPSARSDSSNQRGDGAIEALELLSETLLRPWQLGPGGGPPPTWGHHGLPKLPGQHRVPAHRSDGLDTKALERRLAAGRVPKSSTPSPTIRTSPGEPLRGSAPGPWWSWPVAPGFLLVEDMAYRELGFAGERLTSIWSLVPDTVVQVGTFSKTFFPGSGWGGARGQGRGQIDPGQAEHRSVRRRPGSAPVRGVRRSGLLEEQNARGRSLYGRRCSLLVESLETHMPEGVAWTRPRGGFLVG